MMSPQIALHDPVFRAYLVLVPASLLLGGLILGLIRLVWIRDLGSIWMTYRSWLIMGPVGLAVVFAGRVPFILGVALLSIFAFREFARASQLSRDQGTTTAVYSTIVLVAALAISADLRNWEQATIALGVFLVLPALVLPLFLLIPILCNEASGAVQRLALAILGFTLVVWMFGHLGFLANSKHAYGFTCYIIFATELADIAAFTFGKLFGRHPLRSEISPNKTWEGALGAFVVAMALPWLLRFSFPFFGTRQLVLTGLIVGVGGQLGDLSLSLLKRNFDTKDMGSMIPGHGGILDRVDSLIFVAPLFLTMTNYYYG